MRWGLMKDAFFDIVLGGLVDHVMWRALRDGLIGTMALILRILLLALFPISVPLIAWMVIHDRKRREEQQAEFSARVRRDWNKLVKPAPSHTTNKEK